MLQLGTACATEALQAAQKAAGDVRAVDLNMGCPVKFSLQGGMGSALLTEPEKVRDILTTLRRNLPSSLPVTAKIRLLDDDKTTLELAQMIASCGVAALAVHARRRHDRPRHWAQWCAAPRARRSPFRISPVGAPLTAPRPRARTRRDQFKLLRETMPSSLPLVLNGDVFAPADVPRAFEESGADSLMLARGALWNPSIFAVGHGRPMAPQAAVVSRFLELCAQTECPVGNAKYTAMLMLEGAGKLPPFKMIQTAKTMADLRAGAAACADCAHFTQPGGQFCPAVLEPPPDLPAAPSLPINSWRPVPAFWTPGGGKSARSKAAKTRAAPPPGAAGNADAPAPAAPADDAPLRAVDATREDRYGPRPAEKRTVDEMHASDSANGVDAEIDRS